MGQRGKKNGNKPKFSTLVKRASRSFVILPTFEKTGISWP